MSNWRRRWPNLADDQRNAGVATGVDRTRAQVRLAEEQVRLAQAQTSSEQALLNLQRVVGLPLGGPLTLTDPLRFRAEVTPAPESLIEQAGQNRPELRIVEERIKVNKLEREAVRGEYLPRSNLWATTASGITPSNTALPTRRAAVQLNVPIFNGGLTSGRVAVAASRQRQAELELGSVRGQVEEDVRLALATLRTAAAQVRASDESERLAERELRWRATAFALVSAITSRSSRSDLAGQRARPRSRRSLNTTPRVLTWRQQRVGAESFHW